MEQDLPEQHFTTAPIIRTLSQLINSLLRSHHCIHLSQRPPSHLGITSKATQHAIMLYMKSITDVIHVMDSIRDGNYSEASEAHLDDRHVQHSSF